MSICSDRRHWTGEVIYPEIKEVSDIQEIPTMIKGDRVQDVKNEGGNIIGKGIPDAKDNRGIVKRIDIIIPNGRGGIKGWAAKDADGKEGSTISWLMPLEVMFAGC